jgi:hypothetical protein
MNHNLTNRIINLGANDLSDQAMRARRTQLLDTIQAAEESGVEIPQAQFRAMLSELFDLNVALGEAVVEDKDGEQ